MTRIIIPILHVETLKVDKLKNLVIIIKLVNISYTKSIIWLDRPLIFQWKQKRDYLEKLLGNLTLILYSELARNSSLRK